MVASQAKLSGSPAQIAVPSITLSCCMEPLFRFHRWRANLRILDIEELEFVAFVPCSHTFIEQLIGTLRHEYLDQTFSWNGLDLHRRLIDSPPTTTSDVSMPDWWWGALRATWENCRSSGESSSLRMAIGLLWTLPHASCVIKNSPRTRSGHSGSTIAGQREAAKK